ncbi:MAG TPA: methyl-accepting chemotaxis protein [Aliidongia sp.]|uniref:methyl-accepting chemotaxis protein n=1 Tax=Aliidongia sp. TaxID=1914230 RepID=UPI002DDCFCFE|nr:methyl-accepting chemotaxis protein [Aliidongia sp.]HEV2677328.1 methyl-accepting chemotaxis protein [Aliidongia sp.]
MLHFFANLKLIQKLIIPVAIFVAVAVVIAWQAIGGVDRLGTSLQSVIDVTAPRAVTALQIATALNASASAEKNVILETREAEAKAFADEFRKQIAVAAAGTDKLAALADTAERRQAVESVKHAIQTFAETGEKSLQLSLKGDRGASTTLSFGELRKDRLAAVALLDERIARNMGDMDQARHDATALRSDTARSLLLVASIGLFTALALLGAIVVYLVVRPLQGVTGALNRLAGGDLAVDVVGGDRKDEVGLLARALKAFKDNLTEMRRLEAEQKGEQDQKERRQAAIEQHIAGFEVGVRNSLDALASAATEMRATSQSMSVTAEEASAQATTVAAAAEQATANVQTVASATEELSSSVSEIGRQVTQSTRIAGAAVVEANNTNASVQGLSAAAQKIGDVVKLISDIASQTNLLALNATIEAARAGEMGKGFAVVATEVKSLAAQTAKATEEISAQISAMQGATNEAVQAIKSIGGTIASMSEIATTISAAVEEQGAATQEIARNVQEAAEGTGQVSSNIIGVNQAAAETGAAANLVLVSAEDLGKQAETLRRDVDSFLNKIRTA